MINFFSTIFSSKINPRNACGSYDNSNNVVQECYGCDSDCTYGCGDLSEQGAEDGSGGDSCDGCEDSCMFQCMGTCSTLSSQMATK